MKQLLQKGLQATEALFAQVRPLFALLLQGAQVLSNKEQATADEVRTRFKDVLTQMRAHTEQSEAGRSALIHFLKATQSYAPHLFFCYQIADLPKTNNDLEQAFGKVRAGERRATGRRGAIPGLVVRGPVHVTTALATRLHLFSEEELVPSDLARWRQLRSEVSSRQEARCKQFRFRKDPLAYLTTLEERLSKIRLRS
ncbi:transposase [Ktedonobacter racemifer DSM 44963]|uniref:Transposase n=1 Tax=Ktedonobacter racemifer DSM 44963 TaxID=485913 RepID=D6U3U1_KTERA|nr:transposase [Ktedonobacter racemifer DSM 44963]